MNLKEAQNKLSADISQLYETYQLISKSKQQFNELDVALLQQQLLYVYHSLLKVQGQLASLPMQAVDVEEVLPMVGLKPELPVDEVPVVVVEPIVEPPVEEPASEPMIEVVKEEESKPEQEGGMTDPVVMEEPQPETVTVVPQQELKLNFEEHEPTLDELEAIMKEKEAAEDIQVEQLATQPTSSPIEPAPELSLLEKLSANLRTPDVYEKITREQKQSLKQAINLNKKIAFVNNLFNENTVEYAKAIEKLNASSSLHEALRYFNELKHQYSWSNENALVKELEQLIEKRYS